MTRQKRAVVRVFRNIHVHVINVSELQPTTCESAGARIIEQESSRLLILMLALSVVPVLIIKSPWIDESNLKWPWGFFLSDGTMTSYRCIECNALTVRQLYIFSLTIRKSSTAHSSCRNTYEPYTVLGRYSENRIWSTSWERNTAGPTLSTFDSGFDVIQNIRRLLNCSRRLIVQETRSFPVKTIPLHSSAFNLQPVVTEATTNPATPRKLLLKSIERLETFTYRGNSEILSTWCIATLCRLKNYSVY